MKRTYLALAKAKEEQPKTFGEKHHEFLEKATKAFVKAYNDAVLHEFGNQLDIPTVSGRTVQVSTRKYLKDLDLHISKLLNETKIFEELQNDLAHNEGSDSEAPDESEE